MLGFDPAKMRRWQEASRLAPDADPVEVMQFWLASNRPNLKLKPFDEAIPAYLQYLEAMEREPAYPKHVEAHLRDFSESVGSDRKVHEITHQMIADYIFGMPYKPVTKRHYKRSIGGAYAWWIEQNWAMDNPAKKVRTPAVVILEPGILSVEEMEKLFRANKHEDPEICSLFHLVHLPDCVRRR